MAEPSNDPGPFRVGRHHGDRTLYDGDALIGCVDAGYGPLIVDALNGDDVVLERLQDSEGGLRDRLRELEAIAGAAGHGWKVAKEVADKAVEAYERQVADLRKQLRDGDLVRERQRIRQAEANDRIRELEAKAPQQVTRAQVWGLVEEMAPKLHQPLRDDVISQWVDRWLALFAGSAPAEAPQRQVLSDLEEDITHSAGVRITGDMDDNDRVLMTGLLMIIDRLAPQVVEDTEAQADG